MTTLSFSNASLIALNKLESQMRREIGIRHNLSQESSLFELIQLASNSDNSKIRNAFQFFERSLDKDQKKALTYRGVNFDKVNEVSEKTSSSKPRVYRGVLIEPKKESSEEVVKKGIVYRGQKVNTEKI